jgi:hypothetical protein
VAKTEIEQVLYNWIAEANSPIGSFSGDVDRAAWVAKNFLDWWRPQIEERVRSIGGCALRLQELLKELNVTIATEAGDEAFDILEQVWDDARELRVAFGIPDGEAGE